MRVIRNGTNYVSGILLVFMSFGLFILADPWMFRTYRDLPPSERMSNVESLLATAGLCVIATAGVMFMRVRVEIVSGVLVRVVNPVWTWEFERSRILEVDEFLFPRLRLDTGQRVVLAGAEQSLAMRLRGARVTNSEELEPRSASHSEVHSSVVRTARGAVWYVVPWLIGIVASVLGLVASAGH
ncbi:hypothetical protein GCM10022262_33130 [Georgenia daeguensis]|uniref:PH domain-containing protein n=1 Tax=Georgenia daeguensis TaxID=908355 RepID=A0ABP8EY91_9MICO